MSGETYPAASHTHASPQTLALEMDELEEESFGELEEELVSCATCLEGLETLVYWLDILTHWDPRVGPEYVTRHRLKMNLFTHFNPHQERLDRVRFDDAFHDWGLARLLLEESRQATPVSPSYALQLAELTHAITQALDEKFYGERWVEDLRAEAAANLGLLERRRKRVEESSKWFRLARQRLAAGTGRPEVARAVLALESLFSRGNPAFRDVVRSPGSQAVSVRKPDLPRPVHEFLERCKAARGSQ